ncbi:MAG: hypothetical protein M3301_05570 [Chloroflexota bacterium]|nr:hypothetical protein [Chloroflexota bacterium]
MAPTSASSAAPYSSRISRIVCSSEIDRKRDVADPSRSYCTWALYATNPNAAAIRTCHSHHE